MILEKLELKHFRNYDNLSISFNKNINIFIGNNAQGKTNILESVYVLAITKSHRLNLDLNLIKKDYKCAKIKGTLKKKGNDLNTELEVIINTKGKKASVNKNPARRISDYISIFNVIIFHPDDLEILKGSPSERRRFLNVEIGQLDNKYLSLLNSYNSILKNRNEYLKRINIDHYDKNYLDIITDQLVNCAVKIYKYRQDFISDINDALKRANEKIKGLESIELKYETSISLSESDLKEALLIKFRSNLQREIIMAQTLIGPHRDDFVFFVNGKNIKDFGSQGQQRMSVLSLKLAEIEIFKAKKGEYPVLLLDDVFSELDNKKRHNVIKYLNKRMQIMITTTDINDIDKSILKNASIFTVDNAVVKEKTM